MKKSFTLILSLSVSTLHAADCTVTVGNKAVVVKENESVSLRSSGKPLEKQKIQDQDSLGSCYANATSTVLQSMLPGNPEISYTHAGIKGASHGKRVNWEKGGKYMSGNEEFISGGYVCETIDAMKKSGGACPKNLSLLESTTLPDPDLQHLIFDGVGKYFDFVNSIKKDPKKMEKLRTDLEMVIKRVKEGVDEKREEILKSCEADKAPKYPIRRGLGDQLAFLYLDADSEGACGKARKAAISELLTKDSVLKPNKMKLNFKPEVMEAFTQDFDANPEFNADLMAYLNGTIDPARSSALETTMAKHMDDVLTKLVPLDKFKGKKCPTDAHPLMGMNYPSSAVFLSQMKGTREIKCQELLSPSSITSLELDEFKNDKDLKCVAPKTLNAVLGALGPLLHAGKTVNEDLVEPLLNPTVAYANQIEKFMMPGCLEKGNMIPLDDFSCNSYSMCDRPKAEKDVDDISYTGAKGKCHSMNEARAIFHDQVLSGISEGRALAVGICTGFLSFTNLGAQSDFCKKKIKGVAGHGEHELAISGYRCVGGKIEYEVVNSWGASYCPLADPSTGYKDQHFECQLDENKEPTGVFWIKEDTLVNNSLEITAVRKKP